MAETEMEAKPLPKSDLFGEGEKQQGANGIKEGGDIEAGKITEQPLYPNMVENPALRWAFIRKVYLILAVQFLFTAGIAFTFNRVGPIVSFVEGRTKAAFGLFIVALVLPFVVLFPLMVFRKRHPVNVLLLGLYTVCISVQIGIISAVTRGTFLLEAAFATSVVLITLTLYTFWAARRGIDFKFLAPFLLVSSLVLLSYLLMLFFFKARVLLTIYGCVATIVYSAFIIHDTDNLIKRHKYDEYTAAAISLYLDVINLLLSFLFLPTFSSQ